jgi:uncharacterized OB-fold protein
MNTTPRQFRNRFSKYDLKQQQCQECGRFEEHTAESCYYCGSTDLEPVDLTPEGEVVTFVVQHYLPEEFDTPLPIGIVETPECAKVLGMFTGVEDPHGIAIGDRVEIELRRFTRENGRVVYEQMFEPVGGDGE